MSSYLQLCSLQMIEDDRLAEILQTVGSCRDPVVSNQSEIIYPETLCVNEASDSVRSEEII